MNKYNIVSGWNRGGTSALMFALRQGGVPVIGFAYPSRVHLTKQENKKETMDIESFSLSPPKDIKNNNPHGFWEVPSICLDVGLQLGHKDIGIDGDLIKVPLDLLPMSNLKIIDKVVIILREPSKVITGQIKCKKIKAKSKKKYVKLASLGLMHNLLASMNWLIDNKIKYHILYYKELLADPEGELFVVCDFLGRGDSKLASKVIDKKLNRSHSAIGKIKEFEMLQELYLGAKDKKTYANYNIKEIEKEFLKTGKTSKWR